MPLDRAAYRRRAPGVRGRTLAVGLVLFAAPLAARAEPGVRILDLPFKVRALRGPRSEAAVSVATSGLLTIAGAKVGQPAGRQVGDEESAPIALVWGEAGGAVLALAEGTVTVRPIGRDDGGGADRRRDAAGGPAPARAGRSPGPLSAYLTGRTRAADGSEAAAVLTIRERQPMAVSTDPKPVPVATVHGPAGGRRGVRASCGRACCASPTVRRSWRRRCSGADAGGLALVDRPDGTRAAWSVTARTPPQPGPPLKIAGVADFAGSGQPQAATVSARGRLQLWTLHPGGSSPPARRGATRPGTVIRISPSRPDRRRRSRTGAAGGGRPEIALVTARGSLHERLRVPLPAPAETGIVVLGEGAATRLVIGLADGRVAVVAPEGGTP